MDKQPYVLSIAGFDPSSGAGITSDIKTFEAHNVYGLSVCTAVTVQNDIAFKACQWVDELTIKAQIEILFERFDIGVVKVGIVSSWDLLLDILKTLKSKNAEVQIVLDPILEASAGFTFHNQQQEQLICEVLKYCEVITPNFDEVKELFPTKTLEETIDIIQNHTNLYLKGGHRKDLLGIDELYLKNGEKYTIKPKVDKVYKKHGSGCVLSSALASNLAKGYSLKEGVEHAKYYTEQFLISNESLLGNHQYKNGR